MVYYVFFCCRKQSSQRFYSNLQGLQDYTYMRGQIVLLVQWYPKMNRAAIHFVVYGHPVAKGMYKDSIEKINGLFVE